jgi:hypothetical protein
MTRISVIRSRIATIKHDRFDLHIIVEPNADGPTIGYYDDKPIAAAVLDEFGRRFIYDGVAPRRRDGSYDVNLLRPGEWIVEPGFVYHIESGRSAKTA